MAAKALIEVVVLPIEPAHGGARRTRQVRLRRIETVTHRRGCYPLGAVVHMGRVGDAAAAQAAKDIWKLFVQPFRADDAGPIANVPILRHCEYEVMLVAAGGLDVVAGDLAPMRLQLYDKFIGRLGEAGPVRWVDGAQVRIGGKHSLARLAQRREAAWLVQ